MITLKSPGSMAGVQSVVSKGMRAVAGADRVIVLWTDGEDDEGFARYERAFAARRLNVPAVELVKATIECADGTVIGAEAWIPAGLTAA